MKMIRHFLLNKKKNIFFLGFQLFLLPFHAVMSLPSLCHFLSHSLTHRYHCNYNARCVPRNLLFDIFTGEWLINLVEAFEGMNYLSVQYRCNVEWISVSVRFSCIAISLNLVSPLLYSSVCKSFLRYWRRFLLTWICIAVKTETHIKTTFA